MDVHLREFTNIPDNDYTSGVKEIIFTILSFLIVIYIVLFIYLFSRWDIMSISAMCVLIMTAIMFQLLLGIAMRMKFRSAMIMSIYMVMLFVLFPTAVIAEFIEDCMNPPET